MSRKQPNSTGSIGATRKHSAAHFNRRWTDDAFSPTVTAVASMRTTTAVAATARTDEGMLDIRSGGENSEVRAIWGERPLSAAGDRQPAVAVVVRTTN